ncbi:MAG: 2-dehydro-3-deoxyphosphooctonate aldolase (KDO 8-P synthase) [Elusimicrobia bacterium]|nr:MAG: 2-dehydro-3-deoxyphosphooctonate aldolase (KDO 8-P synthase) [Elusimicrobiota bacterium]KAF0156592.1 MAG: 2-dehydro-3-deoxyphosphooctonate aldolase (KDO 8-P synthase) [Elusimicrobiota bacterium]
MVKHRTVKAGKVTFSNSGRLAYIAGPCVIESPAAYAAQAAALNRTFGALRTPFVLKASFDKANRTSHSSFRGVGMDAGLDLLARVKAKLGVPVLADIHLPQQAAAVAKVADILQIPAFLCRQTDLLYAAADTGRPVNVKKGQFMSPWEAQNIVSKLESRGCRDIMLTERGASFGYGDLVVDMRSLEILKDTGRPVIFDCTHSVQRPGALGKATGGDIRFSLPLARAAVALGIAGLFLEAHPNPSKALSDGPNSLPMRVVRPAVNMLNTMDKLAKKLRNPL